MNFVDEKYILEASPENDNNPSAAWFAVSARPEQKPRTDGRPWLHLAAAAAIIIAVAAAVILLPKTGSGDPDDPNHEPGQNLSFTLHDDPSDKYKTLPELSAYLKLYGDPDGKTAAAYTGKIISSVDLASPVFGMLDITTGSDQVSDKTGEYLYNIENGAVSVKRVSDEEGNIGSIDLKADSVFIKGDSLIVISQSKQNNETSTTISIYDISEPAPPELKDEYTQLGASAACWLKGNDLYIITNGMGRLKSDAVLDYYPSLTHNGEAVTWNDDDVSILGEPVTLQYSALTVINALNNAIKHKEALYGNIQRLFCGEDWFAAAVAAEASTFRENPVLYTFDAVMDFTGSISLAEITGVPEKNAINGGTAQDGEYLSIISVEKYGDLFRMLETKTVRKDGGSEFFMATAADTVTGRAGLKLIPASDYPDGLNARILWLGDKVVVYLDKTGDEIEIPFNEYDVGEPDAVWNTSDLTTRVTTTTTVKSASATAAPTTAAATPAPKDTTTPKPTTPTATTSSAPAITTTPATPKTTTTKAEPKPTIPSDFVDPIDM